ncbi:hypothetical protein D9758_013029 [Tetrapyrgos nigripes]|uniref:Hcy-binding domain-containing protein n=1 Tax=Tetrapyrgos nigripes TaxID=182062 RepID=A0A8H5C9M9_9AGAR|nr:hypothetical protein D9758_013029 [Tetrapyrgos nigripes]
MRFALASHGDHDAYGDDDGPSNSSSTNTSSTNSSTAAGTTQTGGQTCSSLMCITGIVNGSNVDCWYCFSDFEASSLTSVAGTLASTGRTPGWMAIGIIMAASVVSLMTGSPMVIMWSNSDGSITLSQRQAPGEIEPTVVSNPPRVATLLESASSTITRQSDGKTTQQLIWAFSTQNPGDSAKDATLVQHLDSGPLTVDLTGTVSSGNSSSDNDTGGSIDTPLKPYQKLIIAHGVLLARYWRTFSPRWYTGHWLAQFGIAGPIIVTGFALGVQSVASQPGTHLDDDHKCMLGAFIHFIKFKRFIGRPPQNYLHAILGLLIIAFALKQVRNGYKVEWPKTGRDPLPKSTDTVWYIWVVLLPVLYAAGLAFLPKQYRQEAESRAKRINMDSIFENKTVILDGGFGTTLESTFHLDISNTPLWSAKAVMEEPDVIVQAHLGFLRAGSDVILTSTYQCSYHTFERAGYSVAEARRIFIKSVELALEARKRFYEENNGTSCRTIRIALSLGSFGAALSPAQEFDGYYPPPYGPVGFSPDGNNINAFGDADDELERKAVEALTNFHLERLLICFEERSVWDGIDCIAFETVPLLREINGHTEGDGYSG